MFTLYSVPGCPYAQRTRALLTDFEVPFELHEVDGANRPAELLRLSPTGKVPLLIDAEFTLYESDVINEYLAQRLQWEERYFDDPQYRARQRLAMKQWDGVVLPIGFYRAMRNQSSFDGEARQSVERELGALSFTVSHLGVPVRSLLGFHLATFWARIKWLGNETPLAHLIEQRPALAAWLDEALELPGVQATLPEREATVRHYRERYAGASAA